jgi:hypothetical protein
MASQAKDRAAQKALGFSERTLVFTAPHSAHASFVVQDRGELAADR